MQNLVSSIASSEQHFSVASQGFWPDGIYTAPTDAALKYDIEVSKQMGFNMLRKHIKVEPDRCTTLAILLFCLLVLLLDLVPSLVFAHTPKVEPDQCNADFIDFGVMIIFDFDVMSIFSLPVVCSS